MKKLLVTLMLLTLMLSACNGNFTPTASAQVDTTPNPPAGVDAEGKLIPDPGVALAFMQNGIVAEVLAQPGDQVSSGAVLARLVGFESAKAAVAAAEAALLQAEQELTDLKRAALESAGKTELALQDARKAYDSASSGWSVGDRDDASDLELALDDYVDVEKDYRDAWEEMVDQLDQDPGNQKRVHAQEDLLRYESDLANACQHLQEVAGKQSVALEQKPARLLAAIGIYEQARSAQARLNGDNLDPENLALVQANVDAARDNLAAAKKTEAYYIISAPFSGKLMAFDTDPGETVLAGVPVAFLADPIHWTVETKDLAEVDISRVAIGQTADIELDGLPGETFTAKVTKINPVGREYLGDMTYQVTLTLDQPDPRFLWNMTAVVNIHTEK